jgi:hypothetical protein
MLAVQRRPYAEYDAVIHEFAQRLYDKANTIIMIYMIACGIRPFGGYIVNVPAALIGLLILGGLGYSLGRRRHFN